MHKLLSHRLPDRRGAALTEYGIVLGLIAVLSIAAVLTTGKEARQIFCVSAATLASASGSDKDFGCDISPAGAGAGIALPDGAEVVEDPVQVLANFEDVLFGRDETGGRVLLATMPAPAAAAFDLDVAITGRDTGAASRGLSACYLEAGTTVCSVMGEVASIEAPAGVSQIGFRVDLPADVTKYWENDVAISTSAEAGYSPGVWGIDVSREEPLPVQEIDYDLSGATFEIDETGDRYVFTELLGNRNVVGNFRVALDDTSRFDPCYKLVAGGEPICNATSSIISVPAEAVEIGYKVVLPAAGVIGADTVYTTIFDFYWNGTPVVITDTITVTRKNTPIVLDLDYDLTGATFEADETGDRYVFTALSGVRNVAGTFRVLNKDTNRFDPCYKLEAGGEPICRADLNIITLPPEAVEIGYKVILPAASVAASDTTYTTIFDFYAGGPVLKSDTITVTRKNTPIVLDLDYDLTGATFEADETGDRYVFTALSGVRNVAGTFRVLNKDTNRFDPCYKLEAGGEPICRADLNIITLPPEAVEIGYKVILPAASVAASDTTYTTIFDFYAGGPVLKSDSITVIRKNTAPVFEPDYDLTGATFEADVTGDQYVFTALGGVSNVYGTFRFDVDDNARFDPCYRLEAGGEAICETTNHFIAVPPEAVEIGYKVVLPAAGVVGADTVYKTSFLYFRNGSPTQIGDEITVTRKNTPAG